jgi:hypothetical protein
MRDACKRLAALSEVVAEGLCRGRLPNLNLPSLHLIGRNARTAAMVKYPHCAGVVVSWEAPKKGPKCLSLKLRVTHMLS